MLLILGMRLRDYLFPWNRSLKCLFDQDENYIYNTFLSLEKHCAWKV